MAKKRTKTGTHPLDTEREIRETILDSVADGVFTIDEDYRITSFNRAAELITGVTKDEAVGQQCCDIFRASICEIDCALRQTFDTGKPVVNKIIYIIDLSGNRVPVSVSSALLKNNRGEVIGGVETFRDLRAEQELRRQLEKQYSFQDIISKNREMLRIFDVLPGIAESDSTVLIQGASGTGKELVARAIHNLSPRRDKPMVTVNCGALPDTLLESELFGYKAGAFTDARTDKPGRFALAAGGTLFLDEIADVSPALQVRLLRVLQEHVYEPLGGTDSVRANARIITAANQNLPRLVKTGKFREDLFYRINVITLELPPLKQRREDIPLLVQHFVDRFNQIRCKAITGVTPEVMSLLMTHEFPGNIRELENIIEHAFVMCRGSLIDLGCLPAQFQTRREDLAVSSVPAFERIMIEAALRRNDWSRTRTAEELGINKSTLWRKMKRYGLDQSSK